MPFDLIVSVVAATQSCSLVDNGQQSMQQEKHLSQTVLFVDSQSTCRGLCCWCLLQTGKFIPEKSNIWRDCCDGMYDWVKEHILEVSGCQGSPVEGAALAESGFATNSAEVLGLQLLQCRLNGRFRWFGASWGTY